MELKDIRTIMERAAAKDLITDCASDLIKNHLYLRRDGISISTTL